MKHTLFILALITATIQAFAQSPRIKLNQITKDSVTGSVLISSPTDSGMVYSRDLFISYGADTFLILGTDTIVLQSDLVAEIGDSLVNYVSRTELSDSLTFYVSRTELSDSTTNIRTDIPLIIADSLLNYVNISGTQTITGAKTFTSALTQSGGDVNFDSGTFFIDESENRVGIGTSSPSVTLDLGIGNKKIKVTEQNITEVYIEGSGVRLKNIYASGGWARAILKYQDSSEVDYFHLGGFGNGQAFNYIYLGPSYLNNYQVWKSNGDVGIGTTSPSAKLDVVGDVEIDGKLDLDDGGNSVFIGEEAGDVDDGNNLNVGVGYQALYSNTTGFRNTANGTEALYTNTEGYRNTANGYQALYSNTTGLNNTANGYQALYSNETVDNNTANGYQALYSNETGANNTANGFQALYSNTTGSSNTVSGYRAGRYTSTGANNTDSDKSVFIGYASRPLADAQINQIVIGSEAIGLGSNTVMLGNSSIATTRLQGDVGIGTDSPNYDLEVVGKIYASDSIISNVYAGTSDIRLKQDIEPTDKGLDAVMELNPVSYRFIANADSEKKSYGFIAQEIEKVIPDVVGTRHDGMKVLNYNDLISVLTKAIQEQQAIIETQSTEIEQLKTLITELSNRLQILENN